MARRTLAGAIRRIRKRLHRFHPGSAGLGATNHQGQVTRRDQHAIEGYLLVPSGTPALEVGLFIGEFQAMTSLATLDIEEHGSHEKRHFRFGLHDFWRFAHRGDRISVRVDAQPIRMDSGELFFHPHRNGKENIELLRQRFERGEIFGQGGKIQLSRVADTRWQHHVIRLYQEVSGLLQQQFGYRAFIYNGTLLGAVRDNGFIGHDRDFDSAYISRHHDPRAVAEELFEISRALLAAGYSVVPKSSCIAILDKDSGQAQIDLFHLYTTPSGVLQFPFGTVETGVLYLDDLGGIVERGFVDETVLAPEKAAELVAHIYGPNWQYPDPSFHWPTARKSRAAAALLTPDQQDRLYWADFYAHDHDFEPSGFAHHLLERGQLPHLVIDLGCGEGRDSVAFAAAGHRVLGLDRSAGALAQAHRREGHGVHFEDCDLTNAAALADQIRSFRGPTPNRVLFYGRALLTSMSREGQQSLLQTLEQQAEPGDLLALELRTDKDHGRHKAHFRAYRRLQAAAALIEEIESPNGWTVLEHLESTGLAPYQKEDPVVLRLIALRPGSTQQT